ncbi:MAG: tryptophan 7-halogenase [Sphingomicrobium sp.]
MRQARTGATPIENIVICGGGLAAHITVAMLSRQLPATIGITFVQLGDTSGTDLFYGSVAGPTAYAFNRSAGLEEPKLVLESDTAFSWGTKYDHWASGSRSWIQCFQLPLPIIDGVMFHHYVVQQGVAQLEPFLAAAAAARKGAFVHPPQKPGAGQEPLSRSEYGYQFDAMSYGGLFDACTDRGRVRIVNATTLEIERDESGIAAILLASGERIAGDLFVDCTGPDALVVSRVGSSFAARRKLGAAISHSPSAQLGAPMRTVSPTSFGWRSETPLRGRRARLTVYHPDSTADALQEHPDGAERTCEITLGRRSDAWCGNCVAIGQAAYVVEPLSTAPLLLLERDVERLMSLIPSSTDMSIERREYNRQSAEDHEHAELFTRAILETDHFPDTPYWQAVRAEPTNEKFARKIELFQDRGLLVSYDLEPFNPEDWTILHFGMGRGPARHDRMADRAPRDRVQGFLARMKRDVEKAVASLPSHATYMAELSRYLTQNRL